MRRLAAIGATGMAALGLAACGGGDGQTSGDLRWDKAPALFRARTMPRDRVLVGTVRNDTFRPINVKSTELTVRDRGGHRLKAYAQFIGSYAHGLYGAYQRPSRMPAEELARLGFVVKILPGERMPLMVSFRTRPGIQMPLRIQYQASTLSVPSVVRSQPG